MSGTTNLAATATGRLGWLMALLALAATLVALYLAVTKLTGGVPVCGPLQGCETVNSSEYSEIVGIPIALPGAGASALTLLGAMAWWRRADRRGLYVAYATGLLSLPFLAWLTWLEVAVIEAVCVWCVTYALLVTGGWLVATLAVTRTTHASSGPHGP